jgi:hypothetical protein
MAHVSCIPPASLVSTLPAALLREQTPATATTMQRGSPKTPDPLNTSRAEFSGAIHHTCSLDGFPLTPPTPLPLVA